MAANFNLAGLSGFTDETSFGLLSQAVLGSQVMEYANVRADLSAGAIKINLLTSTLAPAAAACGWNVAGTSSFSQVALTITDCQVKEQYCPEDLRAYWLSSQLTSASNLEDIPFEEQIAALKMKQIGQFIETAVFSGQASPSITGVLAGFTAGSTNVAAGATVWTSSNALAQAQAIVNALPSQVLDRDDLVMYMSYTNFRALTQNMVTLNLFHYTPGVATGAPQAKQTYIIPGTNVLAVPFVGFTSTYTNRVICGPKEWLVVGTGLNDSTEKMDIFYSKDNDIVKFIAKFRIGAAIAFPGDFATNGL